MCFCHEIKNYLFFFKFWRIFRFQHLMCLMCSTVNKIGVCQNSFLFTFYRIFQLFKTQTDAFLLLLFCKSETIEQNSVEVCLFFEWSDILGSTCHQNICFFYDLCLVFTIRTLQLQVWRQIFLFNLMKNREKSRTFIKSFNDFSSVCCVTCVWNAVKWNESNDSVDFIKICIKN